MSTPITSQARNGSEGVMGPTLRPPRLAVNVRRQGLADYNLGRRRGLEERTLREKRAQAIALLTEWCEEAFRLGCSVEVARALEPLLTVVDAGTSDADWGELEREAELAQAAEAKILAEIRHDLRRTGHVSDLRIRQLAHARLDEHRAEDRHTRALRATFGGRG